MTASSRTRSPRSRWASSTSTPRVPNGVSDPLASARDIRETFARMAMNDEETVALIAGGHTFGKTHGAADPDEHVGAEPEGAPLEQQGLGWQNSYGSGQGRDAITSGLEVTWTSTPTRWSNQFFENLFAHEWELVKSPAGANQWQAEGRRRGQHGARPRGRLAHPPADHADHRPGPALRPGLRADLPPVPREPRPVRRRVRPRLVQADAPRHGPDPALPRPARPAGDAAVAGPGPRRRPRAGRRRRRGVAQGAGPGLGPLRPQLVSTAWASASTFRGSDKRGGANGARLRLQPQSGWEVNRPDELAQVLRTLEGIQEGFNAAQTGGKRVSLADLIVLAGCAAVEQAAQDAGHDVRVPFSPGRTDASQEMTDVDSFAALEPTCGRVPQLPRQGPPAAGRVPPARPREPPHPQCARDDRARRRSAGPRRHRSGLDARGAHHDARDR